MEIQIKGVLFNNPGVEIFPIKINESKYMIVRKKLEKEHRRIVNHFKKLKKEGKINSIYRPKNRDIQDHLDRLIYAKRTIKESLRKLMIFRNI